MTFFENKTVCAVNTETIQQQQFNNINELFVYIDTSCTLCCTWGCDYILASVFRWIYNCKMCCQSTLGIAGLWITPSHQKFSLWLPAKFFLIFISFYWSILLKRVRIWWSPWTCTQGILLWFVITHQVVGWSSWTVFKINKRELNQSNGRFSEYFHWLPT